MHARASLARISRPPQHVASRSAALRFSSPRSPSTTPLLHRELVMPPRRVAMCLKSFHSHLSQTQFKPPIAEYKISGSELRTGQVVQHKDKLWQVVKTVQITPGRRASIVQVEFKNLIDGTKMNDRLRSEEKIELVELENQKADFVGEEDGELLFKNPVTFDEIKVKSDDVSDKLRPWLRVGDRYMVKQSEEVDLSVVAFPAKTVWTVESLNGGTAVLENGKRIAVPHIIKAGDKISIKLPLEIYSHRANDKDEAGEDDEGEGAEETEEQEQEEEEEDDRPRRK